MSPSAAISEEEEEDKFPTGSIKESDRHIENLDAAAQLTQIQKLDGEQTKLSQEATDKFPVITEDVEGKVQKSDGFPCGTVIDDDAASTPGSKPQSRKSSEQFDDQVIDGKVALKEIRSKSVSSISTGAPFKLEKDFLDDSRKLSILAESLSSSRESLARSSLSIDRKGRDSIELTRFPVAEEHKEELSTTTKVEEKQDPVTPETGASSRHSPDDSEKKEGDASEKSSTQIDKDSIEGSQASATTTIERDSLSLASKGSATEQVETVTTTQIIEETVTVQETEEQQGQSTPPTAPVSPNIKSETKKEETLHKESMQSAVSSIDGSTESVARSIPMSTGAESAESSPKPTVPFPKGLETIKSEETRTTSGMSTPDMTRTSTPDSAARGDDSSTTVTKTVITTVTTVVTKDGERIVSEKTTTETTGDGESLPEAIQQTVQPSLPQIREITTVKTESRSFTPISDDHESDDEGALSAMSTSPQAPHSPYVSKFIYEQDYERPDSSDKKSDFEIDESHDEVPPQYGSEEARKAVTVSTTFKPDPMSTSFYGSLPEESQEEGAATASFEYTASSPIDVADTTTTTSRKSSSKYFDEADLDFDKAMGGSSSSTQAADTQKGEEKKKDMKGEKAASILESWGQPLGLPSPGEEIKTTPKKERKQVAAKTKQLNEKNLRKRGESPANRKKSSPVYVDLAYVPHHGNSYYSHLEYFRRIRARYYVFSGTEPSREVYNALLEAKQQWEDKDLGKSSPLYSHCVYTNKI